jgi:hypothetical protein
MDRSWRCVVWPPLSPDLYPADYQVWGCMKAMAYARKVHTTGELPWRNLRAARCSNKDSVATLVRKCIQIDGGLFEQPTYVAHYARNCSCAFNSEPPQTPNNLQIRNRCQNDRCVYDISVAGLSLELNPAVVALSPGTPCIPCDYFLTS